MIKYSLQNECLENIEAFSDEQMNREMAVIESVLEIYDKTILMMELSNSDVDIPDCSMFMESTFFQEAPTENPQPTNGGEGGEVGQSAPADQDGQQQNSTQNNDNQNNNNNTQEAAEGETPAANNTSKQLLDAIQEIASAFYTTSLNTIVKTLFTETYNNFKGVVDDYDTMKKGGTDSKDQHNANNTANPAG
jgi:hypothetical protein